MRTIKINLHQHLIYTHFTTKMSQNQTKSIDTNIPPAESYTTPLVVLSISHQA